jgi:uncharacterized protein (DUF885 family)
MTPAEAASSTAANYQVGSLRSNTSAYFTINALGYASEAKWRVETLFLHEAVPGHHMQIARAAEIEGLHPWRSQANFNIAYAEGWALLRGGSATTSGSTRTRTSGTAICRRNSSRCAARRRHRHPRVQLVARQGDRLHAKQTGGVDRDFAVSEVDRYILESCTGARLSARLLEIRELRARAEKTLGPRFDVKRLPCGARSTTVACRSVVLEKIVGEWIARGGGSNQP